MAILGLDNIKYGHNCQTCSRAPQSNFEKVNFCLPLKHFHKWFAHKNLGETILGLGNTKYKLSGQAGFKVSGPNFVIVKFYCQLELFHKRYTCKNLYLTILCWLMLNMDLVDKLVPKLHDLLL